MRKQEGERWRARGGPEAGWVAGERKEKLERGGGGCRCRRATDSGGC
jgi:hypothetical protein